MNDCYWGGPEDQYYYEVETGKIVGQIIPNSDLIYKAFYFDAWNDSQLGDYIDAPRARKVVELARQRDVEKWDRMREAWRSKPVREEPVEEPMKTWWKIWE